MVDLQRIERKVSVVNHGFIPMKDEAAKIASGSSVSESLQAAQELLSSERYQVRAVAVFVLGQIAVESTEAVRILRGRVSRDGSWQVQEILAKAFDQYCSDLGYENALPVIKGWLADRNPNVRRAVTEGLRIWNQRDYFKRRPEVAVGLLAQLKDDDSEYVRRSVGNALRDVSKKERELVRKELATWDTTNDSIAFTYALASRFL